MFNNTSVYINIVWRVLSLIYMDIDCKYIQENISLVQIQYKEHMNMFYTPYHF